MSLMPKKSVPQKSVTHKSAPRKKASTLSDADVIEAARIGLDGVARPADIGPAGSVEQADGVWTVHFESLLPGYPGWRWTVSVTEAGDGSPSVTEVHLTPGDGALLAPEWVPWADRLEEYLRVEAERGSGDEDDEADDDESLDDPDGDDPDGDFDDEDLEGVDLDGVDIDELDLDGVELDPSSLEVPDEPNDVFDHVEFDEEDPLGR